MLIRKRQFVFTHGGKNSASYKILRNRVQREIKRAKHYYYSHKVSDLENTDMKKSWKEIVTDGPKYTTRMFPSIS